MARAAPETHHMGVTSASQTNSRMPLEYQPTSGLLIMPPRVDRHAPGKNYIELLAVLVDRSRPRRITLCMTGCEMCGECPLPELYIIFVLDDSVDFDGFVVPDRMEALLPPLSRTIASAALANT